MSAAGHGRGKRAHEEEHEEHENHERWLVSYADMMTLLMVLFIVMFAISQVDQRKFAALKTGLSAGFGAPVAILSGGDAAAAIRAALSPRTASTWPATRPGKRASALRRGGPGAGGQPGRGGRTGEGPSRPRR